MVDTHSRSFFGQHTGIIVKSPSKYNDFIFITCLRKKSDDSWEKPSKGEGKTIKFSLEEMVMIIQVLSKQSKSWSTYHSFKDEKTSINFKWNDDKQEQIYINIGTYKKSIQTPQITILRMLMEHMLAEKIKFATSTKQVDSERKNGKAEDVNEEPSKALVVSEQIFEGGHEKKPKKEFRLVGKKKPHENKITRLKGEITGSSDKALLIMFENDLELWIPKSTVHSDFKVENKGIQEFSIDSWILEKNNIQF
ncbi:MAG: hypothetical protein ACFE85_11375 [Candidatus Hodarchaeota archaeon]